MPFMSYFKEMSPESQGVDSGGIIKFLEETDRRGLELHRLMIIRHGYCLVKGTWEPYGEDDLHPVYSFTKSLTSTAIGFAVREGILSLEDHLIDFFPELLTCEPCDNMRKVTVRHLLTMNTGHDEEPRLDGDSWERIFVRSYIAHEPGTHFVYNTAGTYMLSAIVQKATGRNTLDYLKEMQAQQQMQQQQQMMMQQQMQQAQLRQQAAIAQQQSRQEQAAAAQQQRMQANAIRAARQDAQREARANRLADMNKSLREGGGPNGERV